jgi:hypothetical protein
MTRKLLLIKSRDAQAVLRWMTGEPTDGQKKAGNYRKPTTLWNGLKLKIENPTGSVRRHADGQTRMLCPYVRAGCAPRLSPALRRRPLSRPGRGPASAGVPAPLEAGL